MISSCGLQQASNASFRHSNLILKVTSQSDLFLGYDSLIREQYWLSQKNPESFFLECLHQDYTSKPGEDQDRWYDYDNPPVIFECSGGEWQKIALARAFYIKNAGLRVCKLFPSSVPHFFLFLPAADPLYLWNVARSMTNSPRSLTQLLSGMPSVKSGKLESRPTPPSSM